MSNEGENQYLDLIQDIFDHGTERMDRTGVGTLAVFGRQLRFDMADGFPALTTKKLAWKAVVSELLWFMEGSNNNHRLAEIKADNKPYDQLTEKERKTIWTANYEEQGKALGYSDGYLGRIYGTQWRFAKDSETGEPMDQLSDVIETIRKNPTSRRLLVSAWNVSELSTMALPPCHYSFQFFVSGDKLSLMWNQRSVDTCTGLPFNIASYALLLHIVAKMTGKIPHELIGSLGDTHIYTNHFEEAFKQLQRVPYDFPTLEMPNVDWSGSLDSVLQQVKTSDFKLVNYQHYDPIHYQMAV